MHHRELTFPTTAVGAVGGGQRHDHYIGEYCATYHRRKSKAELSLQDKQDLVSEFHQRKVDLDAYHNGLKVLMLQDNSISVELTPEIIREPFDKAMRGPLAKLEEVLGYLCPTDEKAKKSKKRDKCLHLQVVVAGGSARSEALEAEVHSMCKKHGLSGHISIHSDAMETCSRSPFVRPETFPTSFLSIFILLPFFSFSILPPQAAPTANQLAFRSLCIAKGAAYATANTMSVKDFVDRGAAIGIQTRDRGVGDWYNTAPLICHRVCYPPPKSVFRI